MSVRGLTVDFDERTRALDDLTFDLEAGSYVLLTGPNGSGKSTFALALVGALEALTTARQRGSITVHGVELESRSPRRRSELVAAVWQRPDAQLFRGGILDEVRAGLDHRLVPADEGTARARAALKIVGLAELDERRDPLTLSGGEQQRLALAAALVQDAPVLVLDEATSALDRRAAASFVAAIERARALRRLTVLAIDHRWRAHLDHVDRWLTLEDGRLSGDLSGRQARETLRREHDGRDRVVIPARADAAELGACALRCEQLAFAVRGAPLLRGITLALPEGAVALLCGDNGAGKTTLLRVLATEVRPTAGRVSPSPRRRVRRGIGYAPQRAADVMFTGSVADELSRALQLSGHHQPQRRAAQLLAEAGLGELGHRHPLRLSGGQRQRLAVALALAGDPALVLLDEPTSAQDRRGASCVLTMIARAAARRVTLVATHEPAACAALASHRFDVERGRLRERQ